MLSIKGFGWGVKSMLWTYTVHSWYTGTTSQLVFSQRSPSHPSHKHQVPVSPFFTAQKRSKTIRLVHTARGGFALIWPSVFSWVVKLWLAPQTHLGPTPCQGCSCSIQSQIRKKNHTTSLCMRSGCCGDRLTTPTMHTGTGREEGSDVREDRKATERE